MLYLVYKYRSYYKYEDYILVKSFEDDEEAAYECMHKLRKKEKLGYLYKVVEHEMRIY